MSAAAGTGLAFPITGEREAPPATLNILNGRGRGNSASTISNNGSPRGAGAGAAAPAATPLTDKEKCSAAKKELAAIIPPATNTASFNGLNSANVASIMATNSTSFVPAEPADVRIRREIEIEQLKLNINKFCEGLTQIDQTDCNEIRRRIDTLRVKLTGDRVPSAAELHYGRRGPQPAGPACVALPNPVNFRLYFIRHSESCANVMKRQTTLGGLFQKGYTDPELSGRGVSMAEDQSRKINKLLASPPGADPMRWIISSSALFRAQQTAMILSDGIEEQRASDRIVVLPYIQETGMGEENKAFPPSERERVGLYNKLPDGAASRNRIITTLFDRVKDASTPDVAKFFKWLGCNAETIYNEALPTTPYPALEEKSVPVTIHMLIVTHTGWMAALYKMINGVSPPNKYENLDGLMVTVGYDRFGELSVAPQIVISMIKYSAPVTIRNSCPDNTCRKKVCSSGASAVAAGELVADDPRICNDSGAPSLANYGSNPTAIVTSQNYTSRIKPLVNVLSTRTNSTAKSLKQRLTAYEPPGAFRAAFGARPKTRAGLSAIAGELGTYARCTQRVRRGSVNVDALAEEARLANIARRGEEERARIAQIMAEKKARENAAAEKAAGINYARRIEETVGKTNEQLAAEAAAARPGPRAIENAEIVGGRQYPVKPPKPDPWGNANREALARMKKGGARRSTRRKCQTRHRSAGRSAYNKHHTQKHRR